MLSSIIDQLNELDPSKRESTIFKYEFMLGALRTDIKESMKCWINITKPLLKSFNAICDVSISLNDPYYIKRSKEIDKSFVKISFMNEPIINLSGVGVKTIEILHNNNVFTIGDLVLQYKIQIGFFGRFCSMLLIDWKISKIVVFRIGIAVHLATLLYNEQLSLKTD
jgi:hypothetical protein